MNTCCVGSMFRKIFCRQAPIPGGGVPLPPAWIFTGRTPLGWHQLVAMAEADMFGRGDATVTEPEITGTEAHPRESEGEAQARSPGPNGDRSPVALPALENSPTAARFRKPRSTRW